MSQIASDQREPSLEFERKLEWSAGLLLIGAVVIALLALIAVSPSLSGGLLWDDRPLLFQNPDVVRPDGLLPIWTGERSPDYFPMTMTVAWVEYRLWGENPFGWRVTNLLLHIFSCLLVWQVLRELDVPAAWLAAAVFAVHPVTMASVAWISELKNVCSLLFAALACVCYLRFDRLGGRVRYTLAVVWFLLALLSKTSVVMLPPVLLLFVWWRRARMGTSLTRQDLVRLIPLFLCSLVLGLVTIWFQTNRVVGDTLVRPEGAASRLASSGWIVWFYLAKDLWPVGLSMIYPRWEIDPTRLTAWIPLGLVLATVAAAWHFRNRGTRGLFVASGFFLLMLFPVGGWFETYFSLFSLVADHWQYVPMLGVVAGAVAAATLGTRWILDRWPGPTAHFPRQMLATVPAALVLAVLVTLSRDRAAEFSSGEALWTATIRQNPQAWVAYSSLAQLRCAQERWSEAEPYCRQALAIRPDEPIAHNNLGVILSAQSQYPAAAEHFRQAIELLPTYDQAWTNLGMLRERQGDYAAAAECYRRLLELTPNSANGHFSLGRALTRQGRLAAAQTHFRRAVEIDRRYAQAREAFEKKLDEERRIPHPERVPKARGSPLNKPRVSQRFENLCEQTC